MAFLSRRIGRPSIDTGKYFLPLSRWPRFSWRAPILANGRYWDADVAPAVASTLYFHADGHERAVASAALLDFSHITRGAACHAREKHIFRFSRVTRRCEYPRQHIGPVIYEVVGRDAKEAPGRHDKPKH